MKKENDQQLTYVDIVCPRGNSNFDVRSICESQPAIKEWAYVLHEHEKMCVRPHYHIYLSIYRGMASASDVAKWFQLEYKDDNGKVHSGVEFIRRNRKGEKSILYLLKSYPCDGQVVASFDISRI